MISAKEARNIVDNIRNRDDDIAVLNKLIESAAKNGKTSIRVPYEMTDHNGYAQWFKAKGLEEALVDLGYTIVHKAEDGQFVDLWIEVSW